MLKKSRTAVQVFCLLLFVFLLSYPFLIHSPRTIFHQLDPLTGVSALQSWAWSGRATFVVIAGAALVLITGIFGRFFCGWICPLGAAVELMGRILKPVGKRLSLICTPVGTKYVIVGFVLVCVIFGLNLVWVLDPFSLFSRTVSMPFVTGFGSALSLVHIGLLAIVLLLSVVAARFWCRVLCPLGGVLGAIARFSPFRRRVAERCNKCGQCVEACPAGVGVENYSPSECLQCRTCQTACQQDAVTFAFSRESGHIEPERGSVGISRRALLSSAAAGLATGIGFRLLPRNISRSPIRPPGALAEERFRATCVRCGECMKVCPTGGLRPLLFEEGFTALMTPVLVSRIGPCEYGCTTCGQVCPSGAIQKITPADKQSIQIGLAVIDRQRCPPWSRGVQCLVCHDVCIYKAIELRYVDNAFRPYVSEWVCVGCGICENKCPVEGRSAIEVVSVRWSGGETY